MTALGLSLSMMPRSVPSGSSLWSACVPLDHVERAVGIDGHVARVEGEADGREIGPRRVELLDQLVAVVGDIDVPAGVCRGAAHVAEGADRGGRAVQLVEQRSRRVVRGQRAALRQHVEVALGGGGGVVDREVGIAAEPECPDLRDVAARAVEGVDDAVALVDHVDVPGGLAHRDLVGRAQRAGRGVTASERALERMRLPAHGAGGGEHAGERKQTAQRQRAAPPGVTPGADSMQPDACTESLRRVGRRPMPAHTLSPLDTQDRHISPCPFTRLRSHLTASARGRAADLAPASRNSHRVTLPEGPRSCGFVGRIAATGSRVPSEVAGRIAGTLYARRRAPLEPE